MRSAKIVCTIGPASSSLDSIRELAKAGMDIARMNFSHGNHDSHREVYQHLRQVSQDLGKPIAILADLAGPKIRIGDIEAGEVQIMAGNRITITSHKVLGSAERVSTTFPDLHKEVHPGMSIYADDGMFEFIVESVDEGEIACRIVSGGLLKSRKGLNFPHADLSLPALTEKDKADLAFAVELGVDYLALSFVRSAQDVIQTKQLSGGIPVIAKIEKPGALDRLSEIADAADGLMVARGDLGIEIGFERVPLIQKRLIRAANRRAKPVITATQMLESMIHNPRPTRAEVSDVANAVLDGTDAVMLSAETASGRYPIDAVRTMVRIIEQVEQEAPPAMQGMPEKVGAPSFQNAIAHAAARASIDMHLSAVVVYSETGRSVSLVSAYRPSSPIIGFSRHKNVLNRMALYWGVKPVFGDWAEGVSDIVQQSERALKAAHLVEPGDEIAITFGVRDGGPPGTTMMRLWRVRS